MARATSAESAERVDQLQGMIGGAAQHRLSHLCATNMGGLTVPGLPAAEESLATDQERHR